ncbi:hypothetical protein DYB35_013659, partial [Aphanomyces astaci]
LEQQIPWLFPHVGAIFEYVDALVAQKPTLFKNEAISTTVQGKIIYAYKLTSGASKPRWLYYQSLLHAREWIAGSSNLFALSSILDDIANKKYTAANKYNLYFVPIVNIDGYDISWKNDKRLQRRNANEDDLNHNWPTPSKRNKYSWSLIHALALPAQLHLVESFARLGENGRQDIVAQSLASERDAALK